DRCNLTLSAPSTRLLFKQQNNSKTLLKVLGQPQRVGRVQALRNLKAPSEIADIDRPRKAVDDLSYCRRLAGRDLAARERLRDRGEGRGDVRGATERRQVEPHRALAARREYPIETEPQRKGIAGKRQFDRLAGQSFRLAVEQHLGDEARFAS